MRPKGKLFALFAIFAAIGLVTATGAFTTVTASRTAQVNVAGDDAALLGIEEGSGSVGQYIGTNNGELTIDLTNVNANATTSIEQAINITNRGTQEVAIQITRNGDGSGAIAFAVLSGELDSPPSPADITWANNDAYRIDDGGTQIDLAPGESIQVGIYIDTGDRNPGNGLTPGANVLGEDDEIIDSITIEANAANVDNNDNSGTGNYDAS